jgi:RNA polymerase sigma-70 factor (ECF subfamily)
VDAEDLVQECLCRAIARTKPWSGIRDTRAYLFTILHNLYVDRVAKGANGHEVISDEIVQRALVVKPSQMMQLEIADLDWALGELSSEQREVVLLIGLEGMSYEDTARILSIPKGTVMSRLSRGRDMLRRLMSGDDDEATKPDRSNGKSNGQHISSDDFYGELSGRGRTSRLCRRSTGTGTP